jgi:glycogen operon protein
MRAEEWSDQGMRCFGMLMDGHARPTGLRQRGTEATLLLVLNAHHDLVKFTLPAHSESPAWQLLIDTNIPEGLEAKPFKNGDAYGVTARSLLLFVQLDRV